MLTSKRIKELRDQLGITEQMDKDTISNILFKENKRVDAVKCNINKRIRGGKNVDELNNKLKETLFYKDELKEFKEVVIGSMKSWYSRTAEEIDTMSLEDVEKAINSLNSKICNLGIEGKYKESEEYVKKREVYKRRKDALKVKKEDGYKLKIKDILDTIEKNKLTKADIINLLKKELE